MNRQGYPPLENLLLEQDNESAIKLLEVNGRTSSVGAKSRHLDMRYFWIKETLDTMNSKGLTLQDVEDACLPISSPTSHCTKVLCSAPLCSTSFFLGKHLLIPLTSSSIPIPSS